MRRGEERREEKRTGEEKRRREIDNVRMIAIERYENTEIDRIR